MLGGEFVGNDDLRRRFEEEQLGLVASSLKREAEVAWNLSLAVDEKTAVAARRKCRESLRQAKEAYGKAAHPSRDRHWVWIQWLALKVVMDGPLADGDLDWIVANVAAGDDGSVWGLGSKLELQVIATWISDAEALDTIQSLVHEMVKMCSKGDEFPIHSMLDQLGRYGYWWSRDDALALPSEVAERAATAHRYLQNAWNERIEQS